MLTLNKGRYRARLADTPGDIRAAQRLRQRCFRGGEGLDRDRFDELCQHVLVESPDSRELFACFRLLPIHHGVTLDACYSAQHYGLTALASYPGNMVEMGRFCIAPGLPDPDILRVAWGALTAYVDRNRVDLLFGCSSFPGADANDHADAFRYLAARHLAPECWRPGARAADIVRFDLGTTRGQPDFRHAINTLPPLLRSYLAMGGWVGDHAVIDDDLNTIHVFTGLEIAKIPATRARLLRAISV